MNRREPRPSLPVLYIVVKTAGQTNFHLSLSAWAETAPRDGRRQRQPAQVFGVA
jgi:hypothetical protein